MSNIRIATGSGGCFSTPIVPFVVVLGIVYEFLDILFLSTVFPSIILVWAKSHQNMDGKSYKSDFYDSTYYCILHRVSQYSRTAGLWGLCYFPLDLKQGLPCSMMCVVFYYCNKTSLQTAIVKCCVCLTCRLKNQGYLSHAFTPKCALCQKYKLCKNSRWQSLQKWSAFLNKPGFFHTQGYFFICFLLLYISRSIDIRQRINCERKPWWYFSEEEIPCVFWK